MWYPISLQWSFNSNDEKYCFCTSFIANHVSLLFPQHLRWKRFELYCFDVDFRANFKFACKLHSRPSLQVYITKKKRNLHYLLEICIEKIIICVANSLRFEVISYRICWLSSISDNFFTFEGWYLLQTKVWSVNECVVCSNVVCIHGNIFTKSIIAYALQISTYLKVESWMRLIIVSYT